jgi:hypothetical protein
MKNIHLIPTDKPSRLHLGNSGLVLCDLNFGKNTINGQNIYITSDEEISISDYITDGYRVWKWKDDSSLLGRKKIILTADKDLIKDGVQAIDDEFLEWFVKNPSCEGVGVEVDLSKHNGKFQTKYGWKIIIPKEEAKQEATLEEVAENYGWRIKTNTFSDPVKANELANSAKQDFINGAKWQQERSYSEEDMQEYAEFCIRCYQKELPCIIAKDWFEQLKNKTNEK